MTTDPYSPAPTENVEVQRELEDCFGLRDNLAPNEVQGFRLIYDVIYRHAFYNHECQTSVCLAEMLWNSPEMTTLLADAWQRGQASCGHDRVLRGANGWECACGQKFRPS